MPEHVHLLISEPERRNPSVVMQVVKQEFAKKVMRRIRARSDPRQSQLWGDALEGKHVWQARFDDFHVWSNKKSIEKLRYMHRNPVQRGLVKTHKNGAGVVFVTTLSGNVDQWRGTNSGLRY
jgi:putative transposase